MVVCAVSSCNSTWKNKRKFVSFHGFPKSQELKRTWLDACNRKDLCELKDVKSWHSICSMHFASECFEYHFASDNVKLSLKPDSCPTLNLPHRHSLDPTGIWNPLSYENHIEKLTPIQEFFRRQTDVSNVADSDVPQDTGITAGTSSAALLKLYCSQTSFIVNMDTSQDDESDTGAGELRKVNCQVQSCAAIGCHNTRTKTPHLSFHGFPKPSKKDTLADKEKILERCEKWWINTGREDLSFKKHYHNISALVLCDNHFTADQYVNPADKGIHKPRKSLRKDAVPTLFDILPDLPKTHAPKHSEGGSDDLVAVEHINIKEEFIDPDQVICEIKEEVIDPDQDAGEKEEHTNSVFIKEDVTDHGRDPCETGEEHTAAYFDEENSDPDQGTWETREEIRAEKRAAIHNHFTPSKKLRLLDGKAAKGQSTFQSHHEYEEDIDPLYTPIGRADGTESYGSCVLPKATSPPHLGTPTSVNSSRRVYWPREAEATLIKKIQDFPVLWDSNHELYMKKNYRSEQRKELTDCIMRLHPELVLTPDDVRHKFNNLKNYYAREKRKQVKLGELGNAPPSRWEWFNFLSFLDSVITQGGPSEMNLNPEDSLLYNELISRDDQAVQENLSDDTDTPVKRVFWPPRAEATLIRKIQDYPALWDSNHELYFKKNYRKKQLKELGVYIMKQHPGFILTSNDVRRKFNNIKNYYAREKRKQMTLSESGTIQPSRWEWFKLLSFLDLDTTPGPSEKNFNPEESLLYNELTSRNDLGQPQQKSLQETLAGLNTVTYTRRISWPPEAEASLIEKIRDYRVLWDNSHELYFKTKNRRRHLKEVAAYVMKHHPGLKLTPNDVRHKFNYLKSYYGREKRKQEKLNESGSTQPSKWEWFNLLSFLDTVTTQGGCEGGLNPEESLLCDVQLTTSDDMGELQQTSFQETLTGLVPVPYTKRVFWPPEAEATLIKRVQDYPVLWDPSHSLYHKTNYRRMQLNELSAYIVEQHPDRNLTPEDVRLKFSNLKNYYFKEKRKLAKLTESGNPQPSKWEWFKFLSFLDSVWTQLPNESSSEEEFNEDACVLPVDEEDDDDMDDWETDNVELTATDGAAETAASLDVPVKAESPHFNSVPSMLPSPTSTSRDEGTPRKKGRVGIKKEETDETTAAKSPAPFVMDEDQDFAFGTGVQLVTGMRKLSYGSQLQFANEALSLLKRFYADTD